MSELYQNCLDLKFKMEESDQKSEEAKARDYKYHNEEFLDILYEIGEIFLEKEKDPRKVK